MTMRAVLLSSCFVVVLASCSRRTVLPAVAGKPFVEGSEQAKFLRTWVADPFPAGTTILDYRRDDAWDGTVSEEWMLDCPDGFVALTRQSERRRALRITADAAYKFLDNWLREIGVRLEGDRPDEVWSLDWDTTARRTSVRGTIYHHAAGELLLIERITLK